MTVSSTDGEVAEGSEADTEHQDVAAAESSTANEGAVSFEDAINAVLEPKGTEETPASEEPDPEGSDPESAESGEDKSAVEEEDLTEEEYKQLSERTQRRIRGLVEQNKSAQGQVAEFQQELETLKPKAERMDELSGFMHQHEITPQHLNNALGLTAMINRGDYDSAVPVLENLLSQVRNAAGDVLPQELQERVRLGYLTEADARELHKSRTREQRTRQDAERDRERGQAERHQRETQATIDTATREADAWNQEQASNDPDWNLKRDRVAEKMELTLNRRLREQGPDGYPRTKEAVRELLDQAKKDVETDLKRWKPPQKRIDPSPTGGSASARSKAQPTSLLDAVDGALASSE